MTVRQFSRRYLATAGLLVLALLMAACAPLPAPFVVGDSATGPTQGGDLEGRSWTLASLAGAEVIGTVTVTFNEGQLSGSAGCNSYFGSYQLDGQSITIGPMGMTEMFCMDEGVMDQEMAFLAALGQASSFNVEGDSLTIETGAGPLVFVVTPEPEALPLEGTLWSLTSFADAGAVKSLLVGTEITVQFAGGEVKGTAGCNNYFGGYELDGDSISFGYLASTMMMCEEGVSQQEMEFLTAMQTARSFQISGDQLEVVHEGGTLIFAGE